MLSNILTISILSSVKLSYGFEVNLSKDPDSCYNRYELRHEMTRYFPYLNNCTRVREIKALCGQDIIVTYSEHPPYILQDKKTKNAVGLLPGMLRRAFETCCYHCANVTFLGPRDHLEKFFLENASIVMPLASSKITNTFVSYDYIHFLEVNSVTFVTKQANNRSTQLTLHMFMSVLSTWPLFLIAFLVAIAAGLIVWVLDTWFNKDEFPSSFPQGPFEGFWWAFVSMTTVGYGDRAPKSIIARLFAVLWILLGITIFSMYTATMTSALTENIHSLTVPSLYGNKIGVLRTTAAELSAVVQENGQPIFFDTVDDMIIALQNDKIFAKALDNYIARFYYEEIKNVIPNVEQHQHATQSSNSYGVLSYDNKLTTFLRTFFETNEDNRVTMMAAESNAHWPTLRAKKNQKVSDSGFFSTDSPVFYGTIIVLIVLSTFTTVVGFSCIWYFEKNEKILERWVNLQVRPKKNKETGFIKKDGVKSNDYELKPMMNFQEEFFQELDELKLKWMQKLELNSNG